MYCVGVTYLASRSEIFGVSECDIWFCRSQIFSVFGVRYCVSRSEVFGVSGSVLNSYICCLGVSHVVFSSEIFAVLE